MSGVTLIALVVTVIVLLILAGVTITAITGDNGIIKQAQDAAEATNYSQAREKIEMQILQSYNKNGDIDLDKLTDNFIKNIPGAQIRGDDGSATDISDDNRITDLPVTVVVDGYDFTIWGSGTVTGEGEEKPSQDKFNITSLNLTSTEDSITAKVQASNGNGATYTYYYKLSSSSDWIEIHKGTETSCTIEGLETGESYDIKVEATNGEESSSKEGTISTQEHSIAIPDANTPGVIDVQGPNWNGDGTASITVTKGDDVDDSLTIEYKKDGDEGYTPLGDGETIEDLHEGEKIYIHLTDGDRDGTDTVIEIKDETNPTVTVTQGATSTNGITVNVEVHDGESGMPETPTYNYYIKKTDDPEYPSTPTATDTNASHTFDDLEQGISYDIKVEVVDNAGNTGTGKLPGVTTDTIPEPGEGQTASIVWGDINWDKNTGTASVTVSKGTGVSDSLQIQYQVVANSETQPQEDLYTAIGNDGIIQNLTSGNVVYARLWDGNNAGSPASINIEDSTNPTVTVTPGTATETSIQITVSATDSESGIPSPATYKYYIKPSTEANYQSEPTATDGNAGYTFTNLDDNTSYDIKVEVVDRAGNTGSGESKGVKTLITIPNINDDGVINVGGPNWNGDGTADVTINKGDNVDNDLTIEYKKEGDDDYTPLGDGETIEGLESGDKIYIHLTDGDRTSEDKVIEIKDETGPTVTVTQGATSTNGITVNVSANDGESGMPATPTYNYYIKKTSDADYPAQPTATDTNASHTFSGLVQGESYDIKVEVVDNAGNVGTGTLPGITTDTVPDAGDGQTGNIVWSNVNWNPSAGTASVTVSKGAGVSDSLQIQYQIVANSETQPQEDLYTIIGNGETIQNLRSGNVVYARLWDGNNAGSPASINIEDSVLPTVTLTQGTVAETSIAVSVSATDNESGVSSSASYKYYYKKNTEINYPSTPAATVSSTSYMYEGLEPGTTYDVKVEVADNAGNVGSDEIKGITTLATIPDINVEGTINVEGPTWSNGTASVTISKGADVSSGLYLEYRKGDTGAFTRVTGNSVSIDGLVNGDKIYVHLTDGTRTSEDKVIEITDTVAPNATISLSSTTVTTDGSITATVTQTDADSGIDITKTKYVYNTTATEIGTDEASYTGTFSKTPQDIILNATTAGTYYLHVLTVDNAGNKKETISEAVTVSASQGGGQGGEQGGSGTDVQTGAIQFGDLQWDETNTTASVTVNKTESNELELQYKIGEGTWTTIENGGTITGLKDGDVVTACLYDGTTRGYYTTLNVQAPDTTAPSATITLSETSVTAGNSVTATVNQTDDKSGIDLAQTKYVYNTTATEIGTDDASYTGGTFNKNPQDIILNATTAGTYYLHVLSVDKAGNKKETISEAVTVTAVAEKFTPEDIANEVADGNVDDFYGKYVTNYEPSNGDTEVKWKIFYAGTNPNDSSDTTSRIYLIADDYISASYAPNGKGGTAINGNGYYTWFSNVTSDYSGSSDVTNSLVKPWLSYLNSSYGKNNTYNNMKAVAYMLDTSVWGTFTDSAGKAEYAIGGPTLDLFCASYNQKYSNEQIQYQANSTGYKVKWSTDGSYNYYIDGLPTNDSLYVISSTSKASAMWLASPYTYANHGLRLGCDVRRLRWQREKQRL